MKFQSGKGYRHGRLALTLYFLDSTLVVYKCYHSTLNVIMLIIITWLIMPNAERDFTATDYNWMYSAAIGIRNGAEFIFSLGL